MPERRPQLGEPLEQLGRLERLDDHRDPVAPIGQPAPGPLPAAEVRQGQDHPVAGGQPVEHVGVVALGLEPGGRRRPATGPAAGGSPASRRRRTRRPRRRPWPPRGRWRPGPAPAAGGGPPSSRRSRWSRASEAPVARAASERDRRRQRAGEERAGLEAGDGAIQRELRGMGAAARRRNSVRRWARAVRRAERRLRRAAWRSSTTGAATAWFQTPTKRWTAVIAVSTSITHRIGIEQRVEQQADAQQDDPLGPLHQAALGLEPERLGLGPLVGDQSRQPHHGERQQGGVAAVLGGAGTRRRHRAAACR